MFLLKRLADFTSRPKPPKRGKRLSFIWGTIIMGGTVEVNTAVLLIFMAGYYSTHVHWVVKGTLSFLDVYFIMSGVVGAGDFETLRSYASQGD